MSALCVHCGRDWDHHSGCFVPMDPDCCPVESEEGTWIDWHPVNRFTALAATKDATLAKCAEILGVPKPQPTCECHGMEVCPATPQPVGGAGEKWRHFAADVLSDDSFATYWKALDGATRNGLLAVLQKQPCARCAELDAFVNAVATLITDQHDTDLNRLLVSVRALKVRFAQFGQCGVEVRDTARDGDEIATARTPEQSQQHGAAGAAAPTVHFSPAAVQPVLERYHIEPSGKMWVEHPPFKEPTPQPAGVEGADALWKLACELIPAAVVFAEEESHVNDLRQRAVALLQKQPCARCAELERERDEALKTAQHTAKNYDDLNYRLSAVRKERDDLKAKLSNAERQGEIYRQETHRWKEADKNATARIEALEKALREYAGSRSPEWRLSDNGELASAALAGGKEKE